MGSGLTTIGSDPIPATTDAVLVPADFSLYAEAIAHKIIHWVVDQAERDTLYAAALAPVWVASPTHLWLKTSGSGGGSVWRTVQSDSGSVTTGFTNGTNFQVNGGYVRKLNDRFVQFSVSCLRKNSTLVSDSNGNIAGDPTMFILPSGYWPAIATPGVVRANIGDFICNVTTAGEVRIDSGTASYTIAIDETLIIAASFFTP